MNPFWVTFYSYKGGVGRTLALVNAATILVRGGRNVFLVDFDLEAPGLDSFTELGVPVGQPGVVEYFAHFTESSDAPSLEEYVLQQPSSSLQHGNLWVMPSGRKDRDYNRQRDSLNWTRLYDLKLGQLMIEEWKATIADKYNPDYVFVDSRTGLTDIGGVCTLHLPDLVIILLALNQQNINGAARVIAALEQAEVERRPQILTVATPVPEGSFENDLVVDALNKASTVLGRKTDLRISYDSAAAFAEKIFAIDGGDSRRRIMVEYEDLVDEIKTKNSGGLDNLLERAQAARDTDDERTGLAVCASLEEEFGDRRDAIIEIAELTRQFKGRKEAVPYWHKAFELDPGLTAPYSALVNYYKGLKKYEDIVRLSQTYLEHADDRTSHDQARDGDEEDDRVDALSNKGEALMALHRYVEASQTYGAAHKAEPDQLSYAFNYAEATRRGGQSVHKRLWRHVIQLFDRRRNDEPSEINANQIQAMHIAYACTGDVNQARNVLEEAKSTALAADKFGDMFSVKCFEYVPKKQFLAENDEFLRALEAGHLWDGTALPASEPED